jgi:hypothetical protein
VRSNPASVKGGSTKNHLERTQFKVETCYVNKVCIALAIGGCVCKNFFMAGFLTVLDSSVVKEHLCYWWVCLQKLFHGSF